MAVQSIDEHGNLTWKCPHWSEDAEQPCGTVCQHHISHEAIQWHGHPNSKPEHRTVSLPPCSVCGAQTFLKVAFSEKELKAPNMWQNWTEWHEGKLADLLQQHEAEQGEAPHKAMLAQQIAAYQIAKQAGGYHTESHAMAMRHVEMGKQLIASGKRPIVSPTASIPPIAPEQPKTEAQMLAEARALLEAHGLKVFVIPYDPEKEGEREEVDAKSIHA